MQLVFGFIRKMTMIRWNIFRDICKSNSYFNGLIKLAKVAIEPIFIKEHCSIFYISKVPCSSRTGLQKYPSEYPIYPHINIYVKYLCAVKLIHSYLRKTSTLREKHSCSFFISYVASNKPVSSKTITKVWH